MKTDNINDMRDADKVLKRLAGAGVTVPEILLPSAGMTKWPVVACDQFTSQPEYWDSVYGYIGQSPSALHMILPEIYCCSPDTDERLDKINSTMHQYIGDGTLGSIGNCMIYTKRTLSSGKTKKGLVLAIDLEAYDYSENSLSLIRASEGTILDRLPPRIRIRQNAPLELSHVILLADDKSRDMFNAFESNLGRLEKVYDIELMKGGGHIKGYRTTPDEHLDILAAFADKLEVLMAQSPMQSSMLFAVGDGNHSLAAAKLHWERIKEAGTAANRAAAGTGHSTEHGTGHHPARYALVEVSNIHDEAFDFRPIHRIVFGTDVHSLLDAIKRALPAPMTMRITFISSECDWKESADRAYNQAYKNKKPGIHAIPFISKGSRGILEFAGSPHRLETGTLQHCLDSAVELLKHTRIDYVHEDTAVAGIVQNRADSTGFLLPSMNKDEFFNTIIREGKLPRKTFSIGAPEDKHYYLECRRIT